ncbi:MAG: glucosyl-dolichyl phosphate glucuronosyltransferase [Actinomycetota bacterium]
MTVAICTHNRADYLPAALRSVVGEPTGQAAVEVMVVDNASTDATRAVVTAHPGVRYVAEPRLGLSHARNRALAEAEGDVVAFLDDDAVACAAWASRHADAFADPHVGATGGPIHLVWPGARPRWMPAAVEGLYAGLDLGAIDRDFASDETPFGANLAVRRRVALDLGGFNPALGRKGTSLVSNEESEFLRRLRAGHRIRYVAGAAVDHAVVPGRDRVGYLLRRAYAAGRSDVIDGSAPRRASATASLLGNAARVMTMRGGGERGVPGAVAGAAWAAEDLGRLLSGRRASARQPGSS